MAQEVKHTPGYEVTRDGRVFSVGSNWRGQGRREMLPSPNADGYPSVRLTIDGRRVRLAVHRLVAKEFLPPRPSPNHEVRHLDGDKSNPSADNLAWGTRQDNANARLIAAAPELLEALKAAKETIRIWHGPNEWDIYDRASPEMTAINAAIAKAEGSS